jgi:hypothetical protein
MVYIRGFGDSIAPPGLSPLGEQPIISSERYFFL